MKTLTLHGGDTMPALGLGTWKIAGDEVGPAVREALRLGYRHLDCAWIYGNEAEIGAALREAFAEGLVTRDELFVTSKLWNNAHQPDRVRPALEDTLAKLGLEHLDLYLMHWPVALKPSAAIPESGDDFLSLREAPLLDTWRAMEACADDGLARNLGVSNFGIHHLRELLPEVRIRPAANQVEMHPQLPQQALLEHCASEDVVLTAYSPMGSPDRPPHMKADGEPPLLGHPVVAEVAARRGATPGQVLIAWAVGRGTSVIPKAVDPVHLADNLAAQDLALDAADARALAAVEGPFRYINGGFWTMEGSPYTLADLWGE